MPKGWLPVRVEGSRHHLSPPSSSPSTRPPHPRSQPLPATIRHPSRHLFSIDSAIKDTWVGLSRGHVGHYPILDNMAAIDRQTTTTRRRHRWPTLGTEPRCRYVLFVEFSVRVESLKYGTVYGLSVSLLRGLARTHT